MSWKTPPIIMLNEKGKWEIICTVWCSFVGKSIHVCIEKKIKILIEGIVSSVY